MIELLPNYYRKSKVVNDLYNVIDNILISTSNDINKKDLQLFIITTDDFTLHDKDVGLVSIAADNETKRSRVIARLQGNNTLTKEELENQIRNYDKTGCTITEDFENYIVTIIFSGRTGTPYNLDEIKKAIDEITPAHILIQYEFLKNTWDDAKQKLGTWSNASSYTWDSAAYYDGRTWLYVDEDNEVYLQEDGANAYVVFINDIPYAKKL